MVFTLCWFATLGQRVLIHPDEGRYAALSLGMLQSGDWITPRLNGILYFEKPAFQYWMGAFSFLVFGVNEFAARFWPGLAGMLSVLTVGLTARRLWGNGQYAALGMAGSLWVIANSHFLNLDTGLMFFLTLALCAFLWAQQDGASSPENRYGMWVAWAAMAGATLSKGLIGLLIPGCTLVLYSLINGHWALWRRMQWLPGIALFIVLAGPWFWLVAQRNPEFAGFFFVHEHFERFLTTTSRREGPFWYFVPFLLVGFMPWTSLLPRLLREAWRIRVASVFQADRFLLIWVVFVFVFFSCSNSKLPSYILPMFPALALLLGRSLANARPADLKMHVWLPAILWGLAICSYPFVGYFSSPASEAALQGLAIHLAIGGAVFLLCAGLAWHFLSRQRTLPAVMLLTAGSLWGVSIGIVGYDAFGQLKSSKGVVEKVSSHLRPDMEIFSVRTAYDQTFTFYLRRPVIQVDYRDEFELGQKIEPDKAIRKIEDFIVRWESAPYAMAMMDAHVFKSLRSQGVRMEPVYEDARRMVVIKP